ncbi:MAG: SDR family NAD(P)-dependent oxidoreductase [Ilumatobacteraceae bacterium]
MAEALSTVRSSVPDLQERVAIVTGGARGIGAAIVRVLSAAGAKVAVFDPDIATSTPWGVSHRAIDISDRNAVQGAVDSLVASERRIDILVNNAGLGDRVALEDVDPAFFLRRMEVNVLGALLCSQAVFPIMQAQGGGKIVNISSVSAKVGGVSSRQPDTGEGRSGPVYSSTKGAILSLTRWLAQTGGAHNILVNSICPGPVATGAIAGADYDLSRIPQARLGTVDDIAQATLFLASQMSNYVTGQSLNVDGGLHFD